MAGERVFHLGWYLGKYLTANDLVAGELSQLLRQQFFGTCRDQFVKLTEAAGAGFEEKQNHGLPLSADNIGGNFDRATVAIHADLQ